MTAQVRALRYALWRQALQTALALRIAILGMLAVTPVALATRSGVAAARQRQVPLGQVPVLMGLSVLSLVAAEELIIMIVRGSPRRWHFARVVAVHIAAWAAFLAAADALGVAEVTVAGIPLSMPIYVLAGPLAVLLKPRQSCAARMRRTLRELKLSLNRLSAMGTGLSVVAYVYLTSVSQLGAAAEVLVMGLAMPVLQTGCMALLSRVMGRQEGAIRHAVELKLHASEASVSVYSEDGLQQQQQQLPGKQYALADEESEAEVAAGSPSVAAAHRRGKKAPSVAHEMVLSAELVYSAGAFATLGLAESEQTFFLSLVAMLCIEAVQVAVHVEARHTVTRVMAEGKAGAILCDTARLRQWLLHQELGEKVGVLIAAGLLALNKALDARDNVAGVSIALDAAELARRCAIMVLLEMVGDLGKDLLSQAMGLVPTATSAACVALPPLAAALAVLVCLIASYLVQVGWAIGIATAVQVP